MKTGSDIGGLVTEVRRQAASRRDFIVPSRLVTMSPGADALEFDSGPEVISARVNDHAHGQLAEDIGFPQKLYDRLRGELPGLMAHNINTIMRARPASHKRLVRTLDGNARAFLSNRYRCIDNLGLIEQLLPELMQRPDMRLGSCQITERRLYIKLLSDELTGEVKRGDVVRMGLLLQNSEVGAGAWVIAPFTEVLKCTNGATHTQLGMRAPHIGRALGDDDNAASEMFSDETRKADDHAFYLKARDIIRATLNGDTLAKILTGMREAAGEPIEPEAAAKVVEATADKYGLTETEGAKALGHLIAGADLSRWGLANAITRTAQDVESYDRASELEALGGNMMLTPGTVPSPEATPRRRRRNGNGNGANLTAMLEAAETN